MRRPIVRLFGLAVLAVIVAAVGGGRSSASTADAIHFVLYASPAQSRFINNADDRDRGKGKNPFGNYSGAVAPTPTNERLSGPFPGDEGLYSFGVRLNGASGTDVGTAIVVCQYDFSMNAFCDASFRLRKGTVVAKGTAGFNDTSMTLAVVGGTGEYTALRGSVGLVAQGVGTQKLAARRAAPLRQALRATFDLAPGSASKQTVTRFQLPTHETYIDNDDDEQRGGTSNPFGLSLLFKSSGEGPFPGDEAFFSFDVYKSSTLGGKTGSATFTCQYAFAKQAFCDATFQLAGGSIAAAGGLDFDAARFTIAITGGSGSYFGASGELTATPQGKHAQRLVFRLG
jgi:hypothetical protein